MILLKNLPSCFDGLSMNGNSSMLSSEIPVRPEPFDTVRPELVEGTNGAQDRLVEGGTGFFSSIKK